MIDLNDLVIPVAAERASETFNPAANGQFIAVPHDYTVHDLERFQLNPNRQRSAPVFRVAQSLCDYINRHGDEYITTVESSVKNWTIKAILDDHNPDSDRPGWQEWTPSFRAQFSPQYLAWRNIHATGMSQIKAGHFLEERAVDVIEPDAATIMDMVMSFDALKKVTFRQSSRLHDGQRQFQYMEENEARGAVTLPERITIRVPVFDGLEPDIVLVRVRYRIDDGSLVFQFEIHDRDQVERTAFERCEDAVMSGISDAIPLFKTLRRQFLRPVNQGAAVGDRGSRHE
mgnify:CR=1 FL=1